MLYNTESGKIAFVSSLLTGRALEWITAVWHPDGTAFVRSLITPRRGKGQAIAYWNCHKEDARQLSTL